MLNKLQPFKLTSAQEDSYRQFFLHTDINQAKLGILLFTIPLVGFMVNDYTFLGLTLQFYGLAALRIGLLCASVLTFMYLGKVKNYRIYDKTVFAFIFVLMVGGGIINATRPQNFIVHAIVVSISVFVIYLVLSTRFGSQILLSAICTIGEAAIIVFILKPSDSSAVFTVFLSLLLANAIAFSSSWQLHSYRRKSFEDITKRTELQNALELHTKHLEDLVAERTEKLKSAEHLAVIGATAGMVGHDIRNPLTAITGAVYLAKKDLNYFPDSDAKDSLKKNLDLIGNQTVYVNKIVEDLQDYTRPLNPDLKKIDVEQTIQAALSALGTSDNITIAILIDENFPKLKTDPLYLQRILANLLNNAVQAMPNGGKLTIKATCKNDTAIISLEDTGEGIPEEVRDKLYTPLITTKSKGQGFGLAVVKRLTDALGGTVTFESKVGQGTKFVIELPL